MAPRGDRHPLLGTAAAALTGLGLSAGAAMAQDEGGGLEAELTFSQRLVWADEETTARSLLGFNLSSETRNQYLRFSLGGTYETALGGDGTSEIVDPRLSLAYGISSRQTALTFDLAYSETDTDSTVALGAEDPGIFVIDTGTRAQLRAGLTLETGREAPVGATVALSYAETDYRDTTDTALLDTTDKGIDLGLRFDVDRRISLRLDAAWSELDRDGGTDVTRERLGFGGDFAVTQTMTANASLGFSRVTEDDAGTETVTEGLSFSFGLTEERPNGSWELAFDSDIGESGRRSTLSLARTLELRDDATLFARLGVSKGEDDEIRPLYALRYAQDTKRGSVSLALNQSFATNSSGNEVLTSRLSVDWQRELTRVSSLSAGLQLADSNVLDGAGDARRLDLTLSYSHDLTDDWALVGGVSRAIEREDDAAQTISDELFIGLRTTFDWRP